MITSIVAAILVLGFLILFHELGHFVVAKRAGVGVLKFSIGFGPRLFGFRIGRTDYVISAIPLGGFVKMVGEDPEEQVAPQDQMVAFQRQPLWKRMAIVVAGPGANILFAFVAFTLVFAIFGARVPSDAAKVGAVIDNMPAAAAGLKSGDVITAVNGVAVEKWDKLSEAIRASEGRSVTLSVQRGEEAQGIQVTPEAK